ncbi:transglycosylase SLT domain-containing protein [Aliiruegeria sabulilitoris]|uniref:transglycosylase SLT domain-containing protein n=1 Tax=Aliiruegeria sabulilitoris TaxID=1510458 RepID=UPI00082BFB13|nr:transglycosylase SLT domain-containing protein [Aliiruegeria sabulilitoris]NDR56544.1 lytic transglycosylase domain-containing protein [Pseudoruegeria sp. M32A2M]
MSNLIARIAKASVLVGALTLAACADVQQALGPDGEPTARASTKTPELDYAMRWDHQPNSDAWTATAVSALRTHGAVLPHMVPRDIEKWCPGYVNGSQEEREAFWVGLISALAKHESTWNPKAVGGGGAWFGLVQISPQTARGYNCAARSGEALKNGASNVSCAIRIMSSTVSRDGVVSEGMRGVAADWGPFHSAKKRSDMIAWTRSQPFCQGKAEAKGPAALLKGMTKG